MFTSVLTGLEERTSRSLPRSYRLQFMAWCRRSGLRRPVALGSSRQIAAPGGCRC